MHSLVSLMAAEFRSCVKVEVAILGSLVRNGMYGLCAVDVTNIELNFLPGLKKKGLVTVTFPWQALFWRRKSEITEEVTPDWMCK